LELETGSRQFFRTQSQLVQFQKFWPKPASSRQQFNGMFTWSSKRPANFQQMYSKYTC